MLKTKLLLSKKHLHFHILYDSIIHGSLVKRLRRRPLTAETRVRFPYGLLKHLHLMQVLFCYLNILFYLSHKPNCKQACSPEFSSYLFYAIQKTCHWQLFCILRHKKENPSTTQVPSHIFCTFHAVSLILISIWIILLPSP